MAIWFAALSVFCGGIFTSVQSGANGALNKTLGQPLLAALLSGLATISVYLLLIPFVGIKYPQAGEVERIQWWALVGVTFGAANTLNAVFFAERLGSGVYIGLVTTASIISSVILDHYGLAGFEQHSAGYGRIAGCMLMLAGLGLVSKF